MKPLASADLADAAARAFDQRDYASAERLALAHLAQSPSDARAHLVLGLVAVEAGDAGKARPHLQQVKLNPPAQPTRLMLFADALRRAGDQAGARAAFVRAGEAGLAEGWRHLGAMESAAKRNTESIAAYKRAIAADPADSHSHAALAHLFEISHDLVRAKEHGAKALAMNPGADQARIALIRVFMREKNFDEAIALAMPLASSQEAARRHHRSLAWGLIGDARDRIGDAQGAFAAFTRANLLTLEDHRAGLPPMARIFHPSQVREMGKIAVRADIAAWRWPEDPANGSPTFLMGFPRSGTTLLDQILSSHSQVGCIEEKPLLFEALGAVFTSGAKLAAIDAVSHDEIETVRAAYERRVQASSKGLGARIVIDKMPLNTVLLPLIKRIFPNSRIVFALRDPRDVVLSCYQQQFAINDAMAQFLQLDTAAEYYDLVMRIFEVSRQRLMLNLQVVRYEDVVANLETQARRVAEFLGVEFETAMLNFQATALSRAVATPSGRQVTDALHARSISRWRRYESQLAPVLPVLEPWAIKFGYDPA